MKQENKQNFRAKNMTKKKVARTWDKFCLLNKC